MKDVDILHLYFNVTERERDKQANHYLKQTRGNLLEEPIRARHSRLLSLFLFMPACMSTVWIIFNIISLYLVLVSKDGTKWIIE